MKNNVNSTRDNKQGRVAFITGGASGLGLATARRLLHDGASVALGDINEDQLKIAQECLGAEEGCVRVYRMNVTDPAEVEKAVDAAATDFGHIDILVNSAGVSYQGTVLDNSLDAWNRVIGINLTGSYLSTQAVAKHMVKQGYGRIVFLASISAQYVWSGRVAYCSSKGGVLGLMKSCAIDLAQYGITANSVSPGPIETPQTATLHGPIIRDKVVGNTPMARYGQPDEIADTIAFLASDDARYITGHDLIADGGLTSAAILYDLSKNPQPR